MLVQFQPGTFPRHVCRFSCAFARGIFLHGLHQNEHTINFLVSTAGSFFGDWPPALPGLGTVCAVPRLRGDVFRVFMSDAGVDLAHASLG